MALLDLCARRGDADGNPPSVLYTREIAEQVAAIYWPQVMAYRRGPTAIQLRQITLPRSAIIGAVMEFRRAAEADGITWLGLARQRLAREYSQMLDRVEVAVAEQPLPRLQIVGSGEQALPFLYDIAWGPRESFSVRRLHRDNSAGLPVRLRPGAGGILAGASQVGATCYSHGVLAQDLNGAVTGLRGLVNTNGLGHVSQADRRSSGSRAMVNRSPSAIARRSSTGIVGVVPPASNRAIPGWVIPARSASCRCDKPSSSRRLRTACASSNRSLVCSYASAAAGRPSLDARASARLVRCCAERLTSIPPPRPHPACGCPADNAPLP